MKKLLFCLFIVATLIFIFTVIIVLHETNRTVNFELFIAISITLVTFTTMLWLGHYFINWFPIILGLTITLIVVCSLFPPWYKTNTRKYYSSTMKYSSPIGYGFIAAPPEDAEGIDLERLFIQYVAIIVPSAGLLYLFRKGKTDLIKSSKPKEKEVKIITTKDRLVKKVIIFVAVAVSFFVSGFLLCWYFIPDHYQQKTILYDIVEDVRREQATNRLYPNLVKEKNISSDANENWLEVAKRKLEQAPSKSMGTIPPPPEGFTEDVTPK